MNTTEKLCRFCLTHVKDTYYEDLGEPYNILNALNLEVNMDISEEPVICIDCIESLRKLFSFKVTCVQSEDFLIPFINSHVNKTIDLHQVYLEINGSKSLGNKKVCRFCMDETPIHSSTELNTIMECMLPTNYLLKFFPEMDINFVRDPIICKMCHNFLHDHLIFTKKLMNVEESIQKFIEAVGTNGEGKIDLRAIKQFMYEVIIKKEIEDGDTCGHEIQQDEVIEDASSKVDIKMESYIQIEDSQLEIKNESLEVKPMANSPESILDVVPAESKENCSKYFEIHDFPDSKPYKCRENTRSIHKRHILAHENSKIKMNKHINKNYVFKHEGITCSSEVTIHKCGVEGCLYETKHKRNLIRHKLIHKDVSEVTMYRCGAEGCLYETKRKGYLIRHTLMHKGPAEVMMYKCETDGCLYETKHKDNLSRHRLIHKDISEVKMHKCGFEKCLYESKNKNNLLKHRLIHKDILQVIMYKCGFEGCLYETKRKGYLIRHTLMHKGPAEVMMYKCETDGCLYETKHKDNLSRHRLIHKDISEVIMHKCGFEKCLYESKNKNNLKHRLIHKDILQVMYKCGFEGCLYETIRKRNLTRHKSVHKDPSEVTMYKCGVEDCSYETKRKSYLTRHRLIHKDPSEVTYKCGVKDCPYETKCKYYLNSHKLKHKDSMYKCEIEDCSYETKRKSDLAKHKLIHKDISEVIKYKCGFEGCLYETLYRRYLVRHISIHKDPSKVTTYKCEAECCLFETKQT